MLLETITGKYSLSQTFTCKCQRMITTEVPYIGNFALSQSHVISNLKIILVSHDTIETFAFYDDFQKKLTLTVVRKRQKS